MGVFYRSAWKTGASDVELQYERPSRRKAPAIITWTFIVSFVILLVSCHENCSFRLSLYCFRPDVC